ncbi:MAG: glycosyltransferase, partial [Thermodesulfovibrionia bacterium]|nr:glycosyltransferase [Thermodesulfovibrionia bacterium]
QKLDKLGMNLDKFDSMNKKYNFSKRIIAERSSMTHAYNIITSTSQERFEQYSHPLYEGAVEVNDDSKFSVIPPGVNTVIFTKQKGENDEKFYRIIDEKIKGYTKPHIIVSSRLDEKKNIKGVVNAYVLSKELQTKAYLSIFIRGIDDPYSDFNILPETEQRILQPILDIIEQNNLKDNIFFCNIKSQKELAATYRYFAGVCSVFALTAFYEPFGLALIEAAACGLSVVATKNGGPSEIFEDNSGILVDPFDDKNIAEGLLKGLEKYHWFSKRGVQRVKAKYTWGKTAEAYLAVIEKGLKIPHDREFTIIGLNDFTRIKQYLTEITK